MKGNDPVAEFLQKRGCPEHVVQGGLAGLVDNWVEIVRSLEEGYSLGLDDYLNDMDGRQMLEEALQVASARDRREFLRRVRQADGKMQWLVKPAGRCLWGDETAQQEGWTAERNWWYFSVPVTPGEELLADLERD